MDVTVKLLLVEDDLEGADACARGLSEAGHDTVIAIDGVEGLMKALDGGYDLIITGQMMPRMDGRSMVRALREGGIETPVLFLSAQGEISDRVEGFEAGADDYLVKPYAYPELLARVEALGRRSRHLALAQPVAPRLPSPRNAVNFALDEYAQLAPIPSEDPYVLPEDLAEILQALRELVQEACALIEGSNAYPTLVSRLRDYKLATGALDAASPQVDQLYIGGLRVEGAYAQTAKAVDRGELPELPAHLAEQIESCIALHGILIGSTDRGRAHLRAAREFNDRAIDLQHLGVAARKLSTAVAETKQLFSAAAKASIAEAAEHLSSSVRHPRPVEFGFSTIHNLLLAMGRIALRHPLAAGLLTEAAIHSTPGAASVEGLTNSINQAWTFLLAHQEVLRGMTLSAGPDLFWVQPLIRWMERAVRQAKSD